MRRGGWKLDRTPKPMADRLLAKRHVNEYGCWIYTGRLAQDGYGLISAGRRDEGKVRVHRAAWTVWRGAIPDGLFVLHNCPEEDNRACFNPDHLWLGTQADNMRDMEQKGRRARGERHGRTKARRAM